MKHKRPPNRPSPEQLRIPSERRNWLSCRSDCEAFSERPTLPRTMREAFVQVASSLGARIAAEIGDSVMLSNTPDNWKGFLILIGNLRALYPSEAREMSNRTRDVVDAIRDAVLRRESQAPDRGAVEVPAEAMAAARAVMSETFGD